ncbi:MAG: hypothetical protein AAF441_01455 [Pseudomonadota bacterium]
MTTSPQRYWSMPSNSGRDMCTVSLVRTVRSGDETEAYVADVQLRSEFWDLANENNRNHVPEATVELHQMLFSRAKLDAFVDELGRQPQYLTPVFCDPCASSGQRFLMSVGPAEDLITDVYKPAFSVSFHSSSNLEGRMSYVIDQTCIDAFLESCRGFLRN